MSKHIIKIVSICALVILLPLIIVGVSLSVTEPVACLLSVAQSGINGQYAEGNISITVEGKEIDGNSVKVKKHSEVTVSFVGEGYDFIGWFDGKAEEIQSDAEALTKEKSYTFILREKTDLTAVRNVIVYSVTYTGTIDNGADVSTQINPVTQNVEYGADLATIIPQDGGEFQGWQVIGDQGASADATILTKAKFGEQKNVNLQPAWANQMVIKYKKGDVTIAQQRFNEGSTIALLTESSDFVKNNITAGKRFVGWMDSSEQEVTSVTYDSNGLTLYMKEEAIDYTLTLKYHAVSDETKTMIYNVEEGFTGENYNGFVRDYYALTGYEYNGTTYTDVTSLFVQDSSLAQAIVSEIVKGNTSGIITAVWECEFDSITINLIGASTYEDEDLGMGTWIICGTKDGKDDVALEELNIKIDFEDSVLGYDLTDKIYEKFIANYSNIHIYNGPSVEILTSKEVLVMQETTGYGLYFNKNVTFTDILTKTGFNLKLDFTITFIFG